MVKNFLYLIICTGLLSIFPVKFAHTDEIPFRVKTDLKDPLWISCKGPFFRNSGCVHIDTPQPDFELFYSAEINSFSPYGEWRCDVYALPICVGVAGRKVFNIYRHPVPDTRVDLTIVPCDTCFNDKYAIKVNTDHTCCGVSANAFLGDRPQHSKPDKDTFSFSDTEGDEVTLKLEEDGSVGHIGQEATLRLRGPAGTSINEVKTGELPLEITATIPNSGDYEIIVDQKSIPDNTRYRGGYIITLDSSLNDVNEIDPGKDVE